MKQSLLVIVFVFSCSSPNFAKRKDNVTHDIIQIKTDSIQIKSDKLEINKGDKTTNLQLKSEEKTIENELIHKTNEMDDSNQIELNKKYQFKKIQKSLIKDAFFLKQNSYLDSITILSYPAKKQTEWIEKQVWRVQVFVSSDPLKAELLQKEIQSQYAISSYVIEQAGLIKIQVGDYETRLDADKLCENLKSQKYPSAFVLQAMQRVDKATVTVSKNADQNRYRIQVGSYTNELKALEIKKHYSEFIFSNIDIIKDGNLYKVLIGSEDKRENLNDLIQILKDRKLPHFITNKY